MPVSAGAIGPGEASLSAGLGPALAVQGQTHAGAQVAFRLLRGFSDSWAGRLGLEAAWLPTSGAAIHYTTQSLGFTWAADILNLVPFADVGLVLGDIRGGGMASGQRLGPQVGIGADYLFSRHLTFSLLAHADYFVFRLAGAQTTRPTQITVGFYLGRVF
jgi:hypothetical protein